MAIDRLNGKYRVKKKLGSYGTFYVGIFNDYKDAEDANDELDYLHVMDEKYIKDVLPELNRIRKKYMPNYVPLTMNTLLRRHIKRYYKRGVFTHSYQKAVEYLVELYKMDKTYIEEEVNEIGQIYYKGI